LNRCAGEQVQHARIGLADAKLSDTITGLAAGFLGTG
jgi:hypothetical protein